MVVAALTYEYCDPIKSIEKSIVPFEIITSGIYLVYEGQIDMYYKNNTIPLLMFEPGSYFGDISYIFRAKNQF